MQLCNLTVRLGGSQLNTVPKLNATPAEILILRALHGDDAVVDIRPTKVDKKIRQEEEWARLSRDYDGGSIFTTAPGEESKSVMANLFPGAMKKLPTTLDEIGLGHLTSPASIKAAKKAAPPIADDEAILNDDDGNDDDGDGHDDDNGEFVDGNQEGAKPLGEPTFPGTDA